MCSFIYGYALSPPILGEYFELPRNKPPKQNLLFDEDWKKVSDVSEIVFSYFDDIQKLLFFLISDIYLSIH